MILASQQTASADEPGNDAEATQLHIPANRLKLQSKSPGGQRQNPPSSDSGQDKSRQQGNEQQSQSSGDDSRADDKKEAPVTPGGSGEQYAPADGGFAPQAPLPRSPGGFAATPLPESPALTGGSGQRDSSIEPGEVLVITASMPAAKEAAQVFDRFGLRVIRRRSLGNLGFVLSTFHLPEDSSVGNLLAQLRQALPEAWVDANHHYRLQAGAVEPRKYVHPMLNWPAVVPVCSHDRRLGLIDTAIALQHPALSQARIESRGFLPAGIEAVAADHGTAIAALLVGNADSDFAGLVPGSRLYAASVFHEVNGEGITTSERVVLALDWLVGNEVEAINLSLAGNSSLILKLAVRRVHESGVRLVAAAGNDNRDTGPAYPAAYSQVIAVTAVDAEIMIYEKASHGDYIDFAAPGVDVWTAAASGGRYVSGTSYAVPFVTAAVLLAALSRLRQRARDLGKPGRDPVFGHGLLQFPRLPLRPPLTHDKRPEWVGFALSFFRGCLPEAVTCQGSV
ncbi:MAG: S8 family serine peptidase [Gammaproteobacteria bacterium]|nr:S8 family serine peptidase [Gammaproteobacteria bacterium]